MRAPAWYFRARLKVDLLVGSLVAAFVTGTNSTVPNAEIVAKTSSLMPLSTTLFGFVLATTAFLANRLKDEQFRKLRGSQSFGRLVDLMRSSLLRMFVLCLFTIGIGLFPNPAPLLILGIVGFLWSLSLLAIFGLLSVLSSVLGVSDETGSHPDN